MTQSGQRGSIGGSTGIPRTTWRLAFALLLAASASAAGAQEHRVPLPLLTSRIEPKEFGIKDDTITTVSAWSFSAGAAPDNGYSNTQDPRFSPSLGRFNRFEQNDEHYFATLDLPAGAVIDFIGINTATDTNAIMGIALYARGRYGTLSFLTGFSIPAHGWDTDYAGPLGITIDTHYDREYVLDVEKTINYTHQFWAWVEVWWHRTVSSAPSTATFSDVPLSDPTNRFIEALAASGITAGCGGGKFCPDSPVTRRQMAVFLSTALGLHWPY